MPSKDKIKDCTLLQSEIEYIEEVTAKLTPKAKDYYTFTFLELKASLNKPLIDAKQADLNNFMKSIVSRSIATQETKYSQIRRFYQYLVKTNKLSDNPMNAVTKPKASRDVKNKKFMSHKESKMLITYVKSQPVKEKAIVLTLLTTGLKLNELVHLRWGDMIMDSDRNKGLFLPKRKVGKFVALLDEVWDFLHQEYRHALLEGVFKQVGIEADTYVFVNSRGEHISESYVQKLVKRSCELAGIRKHTPTNLRHSAAKFALLGGATEEQISDMMGFSDKFLVKRYTTPIPQLADPAIKHAGFNLSEVPGEVIHDEQ